MKYFCSLFIFFVLSQAAFSQKKRPGYIVLNNGDTVRGIVKRASAFNNIPAFLLYDEDKKNKQRIPETEAMAFGWVKDTLQEHYEKLKVRNTTDPYSFLRRISKGKYSVFIRITSMTHFSIVEYFFKSADGKITVLNFKDQFNKKDTLIELFADCPALVEQIKGFVTQQKVLNWIDEYNSCTTHTNN